MKMLRDGFTLIEVLIVVAILGILVTLVVFGGGSFMKRSAESSLKTDLSGAGAILQKEKLAKQTYPQTLPSSIKRDAKTTFDYSTSTDRSEFCLIATHGNYNDIKYYITNKTTNPTSGQCSPFVSAPPTQCSDGTDNDGDSKIDLADPGCTDGSDNDETDPAPPRSLSMSIYSGGCGPNGTWQGYFSVSGADPNDTVSIQIKDAAPPNQTYPSSSEQVNASGSKTGIFRQTPASGSRHWTITVSDVTTPSIQPTSHDVYALPSVCP